MGSFKYVKPPKRDSNYMDGDEKDALITSGDPFEITNIRFKPDARFGPKFEVSATLLNGDKKIINFVADDTVYTRDALLDQAMNFLNKNKGETLIARLHREERTVVIEIEED